MFCMSALAGNVNQVNSFSRSLEKLLLMDASHLKEIAPKISIKKPTAFQRWQMERTGAEATYNDFTNTIVLKDSYFVGDRIVGIDDMKANEKYRFFVFASTAFHELSHADFDVSVENGSGSIKYLLERKIMPWFKSKFPSFNSKIATHELFGYTAGDTIFNLNQKIQDIMINHGLKYPAMECFPAKALEKIGARLGFENGIEFKPVFQNQDFSDIFVPDAVFVKGKDINLKTANFPKEYRKELYDYFVSTYDLPVDTEELIHKMNNSHFKTTLEECYKDYGKGSSSQGRE